MKKLLLFLTLLSVIELPAQRHLLNPLVDSKEAIQKGLALHEAGKYKAAIAEYLKVPPSDTSYSSVLHELMLSYYSDSNFVQAERYAEIALSLFPHNNTVWYSTLANVYDETGRSALALKAYDTILAQNPYSYLVHFNKGITLFRQLKHEEATASFQQCIMINPYYTSAHYFLGQLAMIKGNMVQAMMSFATNLLITPSNQYQKSSIGFLVALAEVNTTTTGYLAKYRPSKEDNFDEIQEILVSKIALDKKYKLKADLEDQVVRQLQVMMEKLAYNPSDKGFWMQYYVPLYTLLWEKKHFEPLVFNMFSGLDIKAIKDYGRKEKNKVEAFSTAASEYLNGIRESHELIFTKRANVTTRYFVKNSLVSGKGAYGKNAKNEDVLRGAWEFYHTNGRVRSAGNFENESMRHGEWRYYYEDGTLNEATNYSNDKAHGSSQGWSDNGLPYTTGTYADNKMEGQMTTYSYNGNLSSVIHYKAGKKEGLAKYYNLNGNLTSVANFINDLQEGQGSVYHLNGKTESVVNYRKDMPDGEYKQYFDNGKLRMSGKYTEGKKTGEWNTYFIDGKAEQLAHYTNDELDGERISYYANGKIESRRLFKKGEQDGKNEDFDDDGLVFSETTFERGRLRDIRFFDKKGTVISNTTSRKGNADVSFYGADGIKHTQGSYSKDGLAEGIFTYYYMNGQVSASALYKNGLQDGKKTYYFTNNKLRQEGHYKNNLANGYFVTYYDNGQVSNEVWYVDDQRQGTSISYDMLGNITSRVYYLDDKAHGISEHYRAGGELDFKEYNDHGWLNKVEQYDKAGKVIGSSVLNKGEGRVRFSYPNAKPYIESNYKHYVLNGVHKVTNGDGSKRRLSYYKNGSQDSVYTSWHPNGKVHIEGVYLDGNKTGTWKYHYYDGKLSATEQYADGKQDGLEIQYDEFGKVDKEVMYKKGELDGETRYYGPDSQLMLVFYYKKDIIKGYSYEDKAGKLIPMIPLEKGAGVVDTYYRNGIKSGHMVFNEGVVDGDRVLYSSNGKEHIVGSRVNGLENGNKKVYYFNGKLMQEENSLYGNQHGSSKFYNENGTLISDLNYYLGNLHGDCKYYVDGKLAQTYTYHYGELESKK